MVMCITFSCSLLLPMLKMWPFWTGPGGCNAEKSHQENPSCLGILSLPPSLFSPNPRALPCGMVGSEPPLSSVGLLFLLSSAAPTTVMTEILFGCREIQVLSDFYLQSPSGMPIPS